MTLHMATWGLHKVVQNQVESLMCARRFNKGQRKRPLASLVQNKSFQKFRKTVNSSCAGFLDGLCQHSTCAFLETLGAVLRSLQALLHALLAADSAGAGTIRQAFHFICSMMSPRPLDQRFLVVLVSNLDVISLNSTL